MSVEDERWRLEELLHQAAARLEAIEEEIRALRERLGRMEVVLEKVAVGMGIPVHG